MTVPGVDMVITVIGATWITPGEGIPQDSGGVPGLASSTTQ